jgi:hypothetical protein
VNRSAAWSTGLLVTAALVGASCSGGDDAASPESTSTVAATTTTTRPTTTTTTTTTTEPAVTTTTIPDVPRMPLTGEPIANESEIPDRPALVVKISNYPQSVLPQAGLNHADIVFHEIINDNATRLAAVFHSQESDPVGPIRSGRAQDINLLLSLNRPLFAWSGGNPAVTRAIENSDLINLSALRTSGYYRRPGRSDANNLFSNTDVLWGHAPDEAQPPLPVFQYTRGGEVISGEVATDIQIKLDGTTSRWRYDAETEGYFRSQNGIGHNTDTGDGVEQVWTKNIVVMMADYGTNTFDGNPDAQVLGSNPAYVFTNGTVRSGSWLRFEPTDPLNLVDNVNDLNPIVLEPGRTWVEIPRNIEGMISWTE